MKPVRLTKRAQSEIARAASWYEDRSEGLGDKFLSRVKEAIENITLNPLGYSLALGVVRRCLIPRFQDVLFFVVEPDESIVISCLHSKRNPLLAKHLARRIKPLPDEPS